MEQIKQYKIPIEYINSVVAGNNNSFIFLGNQGLGKTTTTLNTLKELKTKYFYHSGVSTPKALYQFLYEHRENETLVFDDCMGLINNPNALSIILSALWGSEGERKVSWATTKDDNLGLPTQFTFNSKVIIITNKMPDTYYAKVVMSRCLTYEIEFTHKELIDFMYQIGDKEIVDYIAENSSPATKGFDLRVLQKAKDLKNFSKNNWRELVSPMLDKVDEKIQLILQNVGEGVWCDKTGLTGRTYRRYKEKMKTSCLNKEENGHLDIKSPLQTTKSAKVPPISTYKETFSKNGVEYDGDEEVTYF